MTRTPMPFGELLSLLVREGRRRVVLLAAVASTIALATLAIGVMMPKEYEAHSILLVEAKNIIAPLMEGRAVATGASDQASIVAQALHSKRILREILAFGGWGEQPDPRAEERMLTRLSRRIRISTLRPELVKLSYVDTDPQRCFAVARKLAEIYVRESMAGKARQSSEAFEFIDRQVGEYAAKVAEAHAEVLAYHAGRAEPPSAPRQPAPAPRAAPPSASAAAVAALQLEEGSLVAELAAAAQSAQRRVERVRQLEQQLDALLGTYTDRHPHVRRARAELDVARAEAAREQVAERRAAAATRERLEQVRARLAAIERSPARQGPAEEPTPELRGVGQDSTLTELVRRYESARDIYQDLLKRRENARVSMELDAAQRGLTVRVHEAPELPLLPTGMRLMHFTLLGFVVAGAAPLGLLIALVRLDPRVRTAQQIERTELAPLLVTIPFAPGAADAARARRRALLAAAMVGAVVVTYAAFLVVRLGLAR